MSVEIQPSWLKQLLEISFYKNCSIEGHPRKTMLCLSCVNGPICEVCAKLHHGDHQTLRVFKASHGVAIRVEDIKKRLDDYGIQPFSINSKPIFFLHSRGKSLLHYTPKCQNCEGHIKSSQYEYCSLACKVGLRLEPVHHYRVNQPNINATKVSSLDGQDEGVNSNSNGKRSRTTASSSSNNGSQDQEQDVNSSKRRRRRKGIPHRSPLK